MIVVFLYGSVKVFFPQKLSIIENLKYCFYTYIFSIIVVLNIWHFVYITKIYYSLKYYDKITSIDYSRIQNSAEKVEAQFNIQQNITTSNMHLF